MGRAHYYCVLMGLLLGGCSGGLLDSDGDGISDAEDCAPDDPTRYTGADDPENDGIDQNCDGEDGAVGDAEQVPAVRALDQGNARAPDADRVLVDSLDSTLVGLTLPRLPGPVR